MGATLLNGGPHPRIEKGRNPVVVSGHARGPWGTDPRLAPKGVAVVDRDEAQPRADLRPRKPAPLWLVVIGNLVVALAIVSVVQALLVRVHNVSSGSMQQTLGVRDRVLSSQLPYLADTPQRGDIVIFGHGVTWDEPRREPEPDPLIAAVRLFGDITGIGISNKTYTVKRIIGLPGDTVGCCDAEGRVLVNGEPLDEPYVYRDLPFTAGGLDCASDPPSARCFAPITVPEGHYLVLGDHRSNSADSVAGCRGTTEPSECGQFVPAERITGKVVAKAWPPGPVR